MPTLVVAASEPGAGRRTGRHGVGGLAAGPAPTDRDSKCCPSPAGADGAPPVPARRQRNKPWTKADDDLLASLVSRCGSDW